MLCVQQSKDPSHLCQISNSLNSTNWRSVCFSYKAENYFKMKLKKISNHVLSKDKDFDSDFVKHRFYPDVIVFKDFLVNTFSFVFVRTGDVRTKTAMHYFANFQYGELSV